jgi:hypothetical protein
MVGSIPPPTRALSLVQGVGELPGALGPWPEGGRREEADGWPGLGWGRQGVHELLVPERRGAADPPQFLRQRPAGGGVVGRGGRGALGGRCEQLRAGGGTGGEEKRGVGMKEKESAQAWPFPLRPTAGGSDWAPSLVVLVVVSWLSCELTSVRACARMRAFVCWEGSYGCSVCLAKGGWAAGKGRFA